MSKEKKYVKIILLNSDFGKTITMERQKPRNSESATMKNFVGTEY